MALNRDRVLKLLALTTSANDHEALLAMRRANGMLAEHDQDWWAFFAGETPKTSPRTAPSSSSSDDFGGMIDLCLSRLRGSAYEFVESLSGFYRERGYLTEKQESALRKFYSNCRRMN